MFARLHEAFNGRADHGRPDLDRGDSRPDLDGDGRPDPSAEVTPLRFRRMDFREFSLGSRTLRC